MNFNENYLWRNKTKLLNLRFSKLHSGKVLLKLEFDTEDQVLFVFMNESLLKYYVSILGGWGSIICLLLFHRNGFRIRENQLMQYLNAFSSNRWDLFTRIIFNYGP